MTIDYSGLAALLAFAVFAIFIGILMGSKAARHFFGHCLRSVFSGIGDGVRAVKGAITGGFEAVSGLVREVWWGGRQ